MIKIVTTRALKNGCLINALSASCRFHTNREKKKNYTPVIVITYVFDVFVKRKVVLVGSMYLHTKNCMKRARSTTWLNPPVPRATGRVRHLIFVNVLPMEFVKRSVTYHDVLCDNASVFQSRRIQITPRAYNYWHSKPVFVRHCPRLTFSKCLRGGI